jgi:hypothetical protein
MSPANILSINRRGFLTTTATAVAAGASTLLARDTSAVSALASMSAGPRGSGALAARPGADEAASRAHGMGPNHPRSGCSLTSRESRLPIAIRFGERLAPLPEGT